ncbi:hypothetical protein AXG93_3016s1020 [Marchantia polymorpha subsp. ruderalis]|nr:hypothetical protein AXG93_3016s1020 [Marchantia polymorpha subsp. ruderalis]
MVRSVLLLELAVLLVLAWGSSRTGADEGRMMDSPTVVLQKLDAAITALEKAQDVPMNLTDCDKGLAAAVAGVNEAQLLMSSDELHLARHKVLAAKYNNAKCLQLLRRSTSVPYSTKTVVYNLTLQADQELEEIVAHLPIASQEAYNTTSWSATTDFNKALTKHLIDSSQDHQELVEYGTPRSTCAATVVDGTKCQYAECAKGRGLVSCAIGFAKGVVGGYYGISYTVTRDDDVPENPPAGSLRHGLNLAKDHAGGVWITFARDMVIELRGMMWVHSHTTVDGRGVNVTLQKHSLVVSGARQVILANFGINTVRGGDTVHIFADSSKVWVDHLTSFGGDLGLVSVVQGSTDVTISNCKLQNHNFNMLLGASDHDEQDRNMRVSVYRNHFLDSMQRMPHCRWGWCHVANNLYTNWGYYAIGARVKARVRTENNVFMPSRATEVTPWHPGAAASSFDMTARIESRGDLLMNGSTYHQFLLATHDVKPPYPSAEFPPLLGADRVYRLVQACAGQQTPDTVSACQSAST